MPKFIPPPNLYKYLPDRDNFFDNPCLRYTPTKELNDPFESQLSDDLQMGISGIPNRITDHGVLSLSANHKNLLMWAHYTKNHCGLVLELDSGNEFLKKVDKVVYSDVRLCLDDIGKSREIKASLLYRNIFHKSIHWAYEEEWRDFRPWVTKYPRVKPDVVGLVELPTGLIKNIYLGMRASNSFMKSAKDFCRQNNIGLYTAKLHPTKFELNFVETSTE